MTVDATALQFDPAGRIAQDVHCIYCGYNLRTLLPGQACPECNQPVQVSLRGDRLGFSDPAWLAGLAKGTLWIVGSAIVSLAIWSGLFEWLSVHRGPSAPNGWLLVVFQVPYRLSELLRLVGVWKLTSPEPRSLAASPRLNARTAARLLTIGAVALHWIAVSLGGIPGSLLPLSVLLSVSRDLLDITSWMSLCIYLAELARRLPARRLTGLTWAACIAEGVSGCGQLCINLVCLLVLSPITAWPPPASYQRMERVATLLLVTMSLLRLVLGATYGHRFRQALRQARQIDHSSASSEQP